MTSNTETKKATAKKAAPKARVEETPVVEEKKVTRLMRMKSFAAKNIERGLAMVASGANEVVKIAKKWKWILFILIVLTVVAAFVWVNIMFMVWLFSVAPVVFWILVVFLVLNIAGAVYMYFRAKGWWKEAKAEMTNVPDMQKFWEEMTAQAKRTRIRPVPNPTS